MAIKKLILDLDMGVDDAMALAYAIAEPRGGARGHHHVLWQRARRAIGAPIAWRCSICWVAPRFRCTWVPTVLCRRLSLYAAGVHRAHSRQERHRRRERARVAYEPVGATSADGNAAVDYLIDAARTYGPDLVYVATGPLSNLALALERDAAAMMSIGRVVVMGGALTVPGNVSAGARGQYGERPRGSRRGAALGPLSSPWWVWT